MKKSEVLHAVRQTGIVPVIRADSHGEARHLIDAIFAGGISIFEVTMTVPDAAALIKELVMDLGGGAVVGAGTVLDADTAKACIDAGSAFVVSPVLAPDVIDTCRQAGVAVFAGGLTPTEIVHAWRAGADAVKVFPANAMGGASYLRSIKAPLPQIELMPTGGVTLSTIGDYIRAGAFAAGVGGDLVDLGAVRTGDVGKITKAARDLVAAVNGARTF